MHHGRNVLSRLRQEEGFALVLALMVTVVLTLVVGTTLFYTTSSERSSRLSYTRDSAYRLAEAGINNAMAILGEPPDAATGIGNNALDPNVFCGLAGETYTSGCTIKNTYTNGYVVFSGTLNQATATWALTSTGYIANPNHNGSKSQRTLTVAVSVHPTLTQPLNTPVWNYIYATQPASTPPTCDETLSQSVVVSSPFYVEGNLCLQQTASITKGPLVVKGRLSFDSALHNFAGTSASPLSDAHILNGCFVKGKTVHTPCQNSGVDNVWANTLDTTVPTSLTPPVPNWDNWYLNASPGPYFPCQTVNGQAPLNSLTFDNPVDSNVSDTDAAKLAYRNDNLTAQNLTPSTSYRCQTAGGELSWNATTKTLTVKGTIYIDGDLYVSNGGVNLYTGQGVIYLSGTLLMKSSSLCGAIYNGACDMRTYTSTQGWNPNANLLCFVTGKLGSGGQVNTGDSAEFTSATFQGAVYSAHNIELDTTSNVDGPMVGNQVMLGQSVTTSFPSITIVPDGMPSNPTAYAQVDPPTSYSG